MMTGALAPTEREGMKTSIVGGRPVQKKRGAHKRKKKNDKLSILWSAVATGDKNKKNEKQINGFMM